MVRSAGDFLRDQGRGVVGALLVSIELLYTMEMWWHGWQLPTAWLLGYVLVGLATVLVVTRSVGFAREESETTAGLQRTAQQFTELVLQSYVTAYGVLLLFGVVDLHDSLFTVSRLGLFFAVPLGFGAALANTLLRSSEEEGDGDRRPVSSRLGVVAVGAIFVSVTMAPTDEMALVAAYAGWPRLALLVLTSVLTAYLILYELRFRGHRHRSAGRSIVEKLAYAHVTYAVGFIVAAALLLALGQFRGVPLPVSVQLTIVLGFPASIGASGAQVVLA